MAKRNPWTTQIPAITVEELKQRLDAGDDIFVLDVREPHEYQICNLSGHLIPLGDLPNRVNELDSSREIVAHCRSACAARRQWSSCARPDSQRSEPDRRHYRLG